VADAERGACRKRKGIVVLTRRGLKLYVPCRFAEWAWANLAHILCLDDYGLSKLASALRGRVVVDVGGGFGYFAFAVAQLGAQKVIVAEPLPEARRIILEGADVLGLEDRVEVLPYAIAPSRGRRTLYVAGNIVNSSLLSQYLASRREDVLGYIEVPTVTLGDLIRQAGGNVFLVKLDIEGLEEEVIAQALKENALRDICCVIVESHSEAAHRAILENLQRAGFAPVHVKLDPEFGQYFITACQASCS